MYFPLTTHNTKYFCYVFFFVCLFIYFVFSLSCSPLPRLENLQALHHTRLQAGEPMSVSALYTRGTSKPDGTWTAARTGAASSTKWRSSSTAPLWASKWRTHGHFGSRFSFNWNIANGRCTPSCLVRMLNGLIVSSYVCLFCKVCVFIVSQFPSSSSNKFYIVWRRLHMVRVEIKHKKIKLGYLSVCNRQGCGQGWHV